jgi:hypothetical protein
MSAISADGAERVPLRGQSLMRTLASIVLLLAAGALTLPAALAAWEQRVLTNEGRFIELGNKVLSKDPVQQELADALTDDFITLVGPGLLSAAGLNLGQDPVVKEITSLLDSLIGPSGGNTIPGLGGGFNIPGLGGIPGLVNPTPAPAAPAPGQKPPVAQSGFESIVRPIALDLVRSLPNTPISEAALSLTHGLVLAAVRSDVAQPEQDAIILDLSDGVTELLPELGLPANTQGMDDVGKIVLVRRSDLSDMFRYARWFDGRAVYFVVAPLVILGAGLLVAQRRATYMALAGLTVALSAGLWILLAKGPIKSRIVDDALLDPSARAAGTATYDIVIESFVQQEIVVAAAGVALLVVGLILTSAGRATNRSW